MAKTGLGVLGLVTGNPALTAISGLMSFSNFFSNIANPNVAISSAPVAGQVGISSPFGMFSSQAPQIAAMRDDIAMDVDGPVGPAATAEMADIAMDVDGPSGADGAGSSGGEDSERGK
jgi:hypothetical protein